MAENSAAYDRFVKSVDMDFYDWRDGRSYDLDAINEASSDEKARIVELLISQEFHDERDIDALARIGTPTAIAAIEEFTRGSDGDIRMAAAEYLHSIGRMMDLTEFVCEILASDLNHGLWRAERWALAFPSPRIEHALLSAAWRCAGEGRAGHFLSIVSQFHPEKVVSIVMDSRPFFSFGTNRLNQRRAVIKRFCRAIGVDWITLLSEEEQKEELHSRDILRLGILVAFVTCIGALVSKLFRQ